VVELKPAEALDGEALAALFTAGYEGYWFPIAVDAPAFALMVETTDVDLRLSRVATEDGEPVAIALVARRGTGGWIGGMGVVASHRRRGIGEATLVAALDAARAAGIERVTLEVLEQNEPARRLYERLGFERIRDLEVWSVPAGPGEPHEVDAAAAHAWLRAHRHEAEPWQRERRVDRAAPGDKGRWSRARLRSSGSPPAGSASSSSEDGRTPCASCSPGRARSASR
jgi:ribosomal protein S18 acetylase RimI-like enzyme